MNEDNKLKKNSGIRNLVTRTKDLHTHSYLTLLSIGQAVAFSFLWEEVFKGTPDSVFNPSLSFNSWLLIGQTLIILILVWADYFQIISAFTWIPSLLDAVIPFGLFTSQVFLAKTIMYPAYWFFSFAGFFIFALLAYANTLMQIKRRIENEKAISILYSRFVFSVRFVTINIFSTLIMAFLLLYAPVIYDIDLTRICVAIVLLVTLFFTYKTVIAWRRFKLFIEANLDVE